MQEIRAGFSTANEVQTVTVVTFHESRSSVGPVQTITIGMNGLNTTIPADASETTMQEALESLFDIPCVVLQDSSILFYGAPNSFS
jgi:hypothetical protein